MNNISIVMRPFGKHKVKSLDLLGNSKESHERSSKWTISYHCRESSLSNMVSESCPKLSIVNLEGLVKKKSSLD